MGVSIKDSTVDKYIGEVVEACHDFNTRMEGEFKKGDLGLIIEFQGWYSTSTNDLNKNALFVVRNIRTGESTRGVVIRDISVDSIWHVRLVKDHKFKKDTLKLLYGVSK